MYNVSDGYKVAIKKTCKETKISGSITGENISDINFSNKDILSGSLNIDKACVSGQEFQLGSVYLSQLKITIKNNENRYSMYNSKINLSYFLKVENEFEEVPLGVYIINEATRQGDYLSIVAYDTLSLLDKPINATTTGTPYDLLNYISTECGIELSQTQEEIDEMSPKGTDGEILYLSVDEQCPYETFRDLLADLSMVLGGFGESDRFGKLKISRYGSSEIEYDKVQIKSSNVSDYIVRYSKVEINIDNKTLFVGTDDYLTLNITNALINTSIESANISILNNILDNIVNVIYAPCDLSTNGDPSIDISDKISYYNSKEDKKVSTYAMIYNWTYRGKEEISSVGSNLKMGKVSSKVDKQINNVSLSTKNSECKIVLFSSAQEHKIGTEKKLICEMKVVGNKGGTLVYNGQANLNVTKPGTFQIIYELNREVQTYSPKQTIHENGYTIINLFSPLLDVKSNQVNIFKIYLTSADGLAEIEDGFVQGSIFGNISDSGASARFDGQIFIDEEFNGIPIGNYSLLGLTESLEVTENIESEKPISFETNIQINIGGFDIS